MNKKKLISTAVLIIALAICAVLLCACAGEDNPEVQWLNGNGAPSNSTGNNGDYYLDNKSSNMYVKRDNAWVILKGDDTQPPANEDNTPQPPETDNGNNNRPPQDNEDNADAEPCKHTSTVAGESKAATCTEAGWAEAVCTNCKAVIKSDIPRLPHKPSGSAPRGVSCSAIRVCTVCDSYCAAVNDSISFDTYFSGDMVLTLNVTGEGATVRATVDSVPSGEETLAPGIHRFKAASGKAAGQYTLGLSVTGGKTEILGIDMEGRINSKGAVILELQKRASTDKGTRKDFYIYVRTSDPSGQYYVKYNFIYEYNEAINSKADSTDNIDSYRVKGASLVKVTGTSGTKVTFTKISEVLQSGEISLAVKEEGAVDFIGGFHGDDRMIEFKLIADGKEYTPGAEDKVVVCSRIEIKQKDVLNRCSITAEQVLEHTQNYLIDSSGVKLGKSVKWLRDDFVINSAFLQMFTFLRKDGEKQVCETVSAYDAEGKLIESATVSEPVTSQYNAIKSNVNIREVRYSSASSGISANIGFEILNNSVKVDRAWVAARVHNDNKWYPDFGSVGGGNPANGELWELDTYFDIDYIKPAN